MCRRWPRSGAAQRGCGIKRALYKSPAIPKRGLQRQRPRGLPPCMLDAIALLACPSVQTSPQEPAAGFGMPHGGDDHVRASRLIGPRVLDEMCGAGARGSGEPRGLRD